MPGKALRVGNVGFVVERHLFRENSAASRACLDSARRVRSAGLAPHQAPDEIGLAVEKIVAAQAAGRFPADLLENAIGGFAGEFRHAGKNEQRDLAPEIPVFVARQLRSDDRPDAEFLVEFAHQR
jgi:hypothetical protein